MKLRLKTSALTLAAIAAASAVPQLIAPAHAAPPANQYVYMNTGGVERGHAIYQHATNRICAYADGSLASGRYINAYLKAPNGNVINGSGVQDYKDGNPQATTCVDLPASVNNYSGQTGRIVIEIKAPGSSPIYATNNTPNTL